MKAKPDSTFTLNFVKAKTPMGLRQKVLELRGDKMAWIKVLSVNHVNNEWFAWFDMPVEIDDKVEIFERKETKTDL